MAQIGGTVRRWRWPFTFVPTSAVPSPAMTHRQPVMTGWFDNRGPILGGQALLLHEARQRFRSGAACVGGAACAHFQVTGPDGRQIQASATGTASATGSSREFAPSKVAVSAG